jgi:hypothetical protein
MVVGSLAREFCDDACKMRGNLGGHCVSCVNSIVGINYLA